MMTTHTQLSIIVPCYNEEQRIIHTIDKLIPAVDKLKISYEIILVNDGSLDKTDTVIKDIADNNDNIKVLSYHINKGKGYAVKCGIKKSQGAYYLIMDADLATDISELKKFWNQRESADCLIGNRKNTHNQRNIVRNIAGGISHGLVNTVLNLKLRDTQCGFKLLSATTKNMWSHMHSERRGFDFELLYLLQKHGYSIKEVDVKRNDIAGSKVTFSSYLTTWKELRNTTRLHNIKTLDRINQFAVSTLAVMGIVLYGTINIVNAQSETTTITACNSYDISTYNSETMGVIPAEACGDAAGQVTDGFPVGGLCRTGVPFLQNTLFNTNTISTIFDPGSKIVDGTISLITKSRDQIIIAGNFTTYNKTPRIGIARLYPNGSLDESFDPRAGFKNDKDYATITKIIPQQNGQLIIMGDFTSYNEIKVNNIVRLNADGSLDTKFDPASLVDGQITYITVQNNEQIIVAGKFSTYDKEPRKGIARLNSDGSLDTSFDPKSGIDGLVTSMAIQSDGSLIVGGNFTSYDKFPVAGFVKINPDGSFDDKFDIKSIQKFMNHIDYIVVKPEGQIVIAGSLSETDEKGNTTVLQNNIVQLNVDGSFDEKYPITTIDSKGKVTYMELYNDRLIVLGDFTVVNEKESRNGFAGFSPDGSLDTKFDPASFIDGPVTSLSIQDDGQILIAGEFLNYDKDSRNTAARLNADGSLELATTQDLLSIDQYTWSCIDTIVTNANGTATSYDSNGTATSYNSNGSATSYNSNGSATSYNSNGSATSYNSNGSATSYNSNGSATSYNSNGSATSYNSNGSATSYNSNGSATSNSNLGICGSAAGQFFTSMPTTNLCDPSSNNGGASLYDTLATDGTYNWTCGINHYTYSSVSCTAYKNSDGVCGTAQGGITPTFPMTNLCAIGTPYLQQVQSGALVIYTWSCLGMGSGTYIANCTSYQSPLVDACIPYGNSGTQNYNISNVILPGTNVALMLNYDYENGDFVNVANSALQTANGTLASAANVDYTDSNVYTLTGIINSSMSLQVSFTNLNTEGSETGQFIQYRQPADISARTVRSTLKNRISGQLVQQQETIVGSNWYGCKPEGWNTSLVGFVPSQLIATINNIVSPTAGGSVFGRYSSVGSSSSDDDNNENGSVSWLSTDQATLSYQNAAGEWIVFIPQLPGYINITKPDERFLLWSQQNRGFRVDCNLCASATPITTGYAACEDLPDHAIPNIATGIVQYTGVNGWFPSTTYTYNTITSTTDCTFICENNYSRVDGECKPLVDTGIPCVGGMPQYAVLTVPGANTYTSTWNGSGWVPSIRTYTYNPTVYNDPALDACNYTCPANYTRNGGACIANNNTQSCTGTLPANATATNGTTFTQTRNGIGWVPSSISYTGGTLSGSNVTCGFNCNSGYTRNGSACVQADSYGRWTGDWSTCTTTGTVSTGTNTYSWDVGDWGACSVGGGTCDGFYPVAGTGGTCSNTMNTVGGLGFSLNFGFTAACLTMDITYNVGRGGDHNSTSQGSTDYGNASACAAHGTEGTCSADAGNNCRWFPYANYGLITTTNGSTSSTPLATCNAAQSQATCAGETINVPGNEWGGVPYSYVSGGINGCYWNADPVMRTCNDANNSIMCELFRPGCTWNQNTGGSMQNRSVVCRNQLGGIVPDSYCPQPKPITSQEGTCNVFADGTCGSANGISSNTTPSTNLCNTGFPSMTPTAITGANGQIWFWSCLGTAGGNYSYCSAPVATSSTPVNGVCNNSINNSCTVGTLNDIADNTTNYLWNCNGLNGGTTTSCSLAKPVEYGRITLTAINRGAGSAIISPVNLILHNLSTNQNINWGVAAYRDVPVGIYSATFMCENSHTLNVTGPYNVSPNINVVSNGVATTIQC